ncbi:MAG: hypothetical protein M3P04_05175 [Actinomycetota bacterium]|nr:hypothetical protein [Actinomycetota bacterium]
MIVLRIVELVPVLAILYGTFLLGQLNQRRKYRDRRDPLPVIQAARTLLTERNVRGDEGVSNAAAGGLQLALDDWDLRAVN